MINLKIEKVSEMSIKMLVARMLNDSERNYAIKKVNKILTNTNNGFLEVSPVWFEENGDLFYNILFSIKRECLDGINEDLYLPNLILKVNEFGKIDFYHGSLQKFIKVWNRLADIEEKWGEDE